MLEINKKQLLSFDEINRARILKYIALGLIKYKESDYKWTVQYAIQNLKKLAIQKKYGGVLIQ